MSIVKKIFSTRLAMFVTIVVTLMTFSLFQNKTAFPHDSNYYWNMANSVFKNGFHILNFPETFRGYLLPVLVGIAKHNVIKLGIPDYWGWRLLISVMISVVLVYAFPVIFKKTLHVSWHTYLANGVYILIFLIFGGDFIQYPLSDFPACFFMLTGVASLVWVKDKPGNICKIVGGIIAGVSLYAAYNTRVAYLYGVIIAVIVFAIYLLTKKSYKNLLVLMSLIIGMLLIAAPQMMINYQYVGRLSPKVYTENFTGYGYSLEVRQLFWGLSYSKYETYVGDPADYPTPMSHFADPAGSEILQREKNTMESFDDNSYRTLVKLFLKYPLDMGGMYFRHLLGLMTPFYTQIYITDMYTGKGILISLAILLWMIAAIDILFDYKKKFDKMTLCMLAALVLPSLLQLAGEPELRFFLMVYLLLYYYVTNIIDYRELYQNIKRRWVPIVFACAVIYFMWISNIGMILSYNEQKTLIINDNHFESISETEESSTLP